MKKITFCLMATCLSLTFYPLQSTAGTTDPISADMTNPPLSAAGTATLLRLNEIKDMDKSNLSSSEKKELRKEVRSLRHDLRKSDKGVYLSIGAIIIIILLLILIL